MHAFTWHDTLLDIPEYPLYLIRFEELYESLENTQLTSAAKEIMTKMAWDFVIFSHSVSSKSFKEAQSYLKKITAALNDLNNALPDQNPKAIINLQKFIQNLEKQYRHFLLKKNLS